MASGPVGIPDDFEILKNIDGPGPASEYLARNKTDDALVMLRTYDLTGIDDETARRQLREYLRNELTFLDELDLPGVIRLYDYSDARKSFWIATKPPKLTRLSRSFDLLQSETLETRQGLIRRFLSILRQIHERRIVHRNLSSDAVFLDNKPQIYIGDFGCAAYINDQPVHTRTISSTTPSCYQAPEIKDAQTFAPSAGCDIYSAALLVFEILSASALNKENIGEILNVLHSGLEVQLSKGIIGTETSEVILKATDPIIENRWPSIKDFAGALEQSLKRGPEDYTRPVEPSPSVDVTRPVDSMQTRPVQAESPAAQYVPVSPQKPPDATQTITPLDPSHEIWNNHYEIIEKIGEGGQAIVYRAHDHLTNEPIAIKTIWSRHRTDIAAINRLKQGAMIARSLTHRYIIRTYSVEQRLDVTGPGQHVFICMELIKSRLDLSNVIDIRQAEEKKFSVEEALHVIRQLLDSLKYAHEHTIHRDIKPGNIMLVQRDDQAEIDTSDLTKFDIKLIDFGIAKVLNEKRIEVTGKGFRSAHYGAPELADARTAVDARADVYSVGVMLYQLLTKTLPRKGSPPANKVNKDVPAALAAAVDLSINADRSKRFKTAAEFLKEIDRAVSRFNWVRKVAKIAAVLIVAACIGAAIRFFMPQPDYGNVAQTIDDLEQRNPDVQITTLDKSPPIRYLDIQDFNNYDVLRRNAIEGLQSNLDAGNDTFNKKTFSIWKDQEQSWNRIEPAVNTIEVISEVRKEYVARKGMDVLDSLMELEPSSGMLAKVKDKTSEAEQLLKRRPFSVDTLNICAEAYDLGAKTYQNIESLSQELDVPQKANRINDQLKEVDKLRSDYQETQNSFSFERFGDSQFEARIKKCLQKADRSYQRFELAGSAKYFSLLTQICGTIAAVEDQVDFKKTDMPLVTARLMDLCYEDIGAFENYPAWTERLQQVHQMKAFIARYRSLQKLISKISMNVPAAVSHRISDARRLCEQGDLNAARDRLVSAAEEYRDFIRHGIDLMRRDCDFLSTRPDIETDRIEYLKSLQAQLSASIDKPNWLVSEFADQHNRCLEEISITKETVRKKFITDARALKQKINQSDLTARQQDFFWRSERIGQYIEVAAKYLPDEVDTSIANWKYVEDLSRLSTIMDRMQKLSSRLDLMLKRKEQLDTLAKALDQDVRFCEEFRGVSSLEKEKYEQWKTQLQQLKSSLSTRANTGYLIDQKQDIFSSEFNDLNVSFSKIHEQLPYHRTRVIQIIERTQALQQRANQVLRLQKHWAGVIEPLSSPSLKQDFGQISNYLEGIKEQVNQWSTEKFGNEMHPKCKILNDALNEQSQALASLISAILDEKKKLTTNLNSYEKSLTEIFNDQDIRRLDALSAEDNRPELIRFRQIPDQLKGINQELSDVDVRAWDAAQRTITLESTTDFIVDTWLVDFTSKSRELNTEFSQLEDVAQAANVFQQIQKMLSQQDQLEKQYYLALRDIAVKTIDYSDVAQKADAIENDRSIAGMCNFLEQLENDSVFRLGQIKSNLSSIADELTNLKTMNVPGIKEIKDFSRRRDQLLSSIADFKQELDKLSIENLEVVCKDAVTKTVQDIRDLIARPDQSRRFKSLNSAMWTFFAEHRDWEQWTEFLELYHFRLSGKDIHLTMSDQLKPTTKDGGNLNLTEIADSFENAFYLAYDMPDNFGWPLYISHQKDPSIIFVFVRGSKARNIEPFYMSVREISNGQYRLFMEQTGAKSQSKLQGWSYFIDINKKVLILQAQGQYPPCRVTWNESTTSFTIDEDFTDVPVTWVTYDGAQAFAAWLSGKLPTVSEHKYASLAGAETAYPWGIDLEHAVSYAHVRSTAWQKAARKYNAALDNPVEIAHPPVGAIKDFVSGKALDPIGIVHKNDSQNIAWPTVANKKANAWDLYDMVGNVWEWCTDVQNDSKSVICGGSCLAPPEYVEPGSVYEFKAQACDVGFRIVISTR